MRPAVQRVASLFSDDGRVLLVVLGFSLVVRVASLGTVSAADAVIKWAAARALLHGAPLRAEVFDHHAARWAINLPTLAAQALFGESVWVYYVPILVVTTVLALFTFLVGKAIAGAWVGALSVMLYTPLPAMNYVGSQLMPEMFLACYIMAALWALLRSFDEPGRRFLWISVACFCAAYMAKETAVFFLPGIVIAVFFGRRKIWEAAAYGAGFVAFVGVETLAYRLTYGFAWGRASIIARHHLGHPKMRPPIDSIGDLLGRYLDLNPGFRELFYAALVAAVILPFLKRSARFDRKRLFALLVVCGAFFFASTFALQSLNPPRLVQPLRERYLYPAAPLLALLVVTFVRALLPSSFALPQRLRLLPVFASVTAALAIALWLLRNPPGHEHAVVTMERYQTLLQDAYRAGDPIVSVDVQRHAVGAVESLFLTFEQSRRSRVLYPKPGTRGQKPRVIVDGSLPKYAGQGKIELTSVLSTWNRQRHVLVTMLADFIAREKKPSRR